MNFREYLSESNISESNRFQTLRNEINDAGGNIINLVDLLNKKFKIKIKTGSNRKQTLNRIVFALADMESFDRDFKEYVSIIRKFGNDERTSNSKT